MPGGTQYRPVIVTYTYDTVGNPTSITEARPDTRSGSTGQLPPLVDRQCFTYDAMGQLVKAWTGKTESCTEPTDLDPTHATAGPDGEGACPPPHGQASPACGTRTSRQCCALGTSWNPAPSHTARMGRNHSAMNA